MIEHSIFFMIFHKLLKNQILKKDTDKLIHCKQIKKDQNKWRNKMQQYDVSIKKQNSHITGHLKKQANKTIC